ncbi:MAG: hypothetical protein AB7S93_21655 [Xanthobacteraceae bacterium]
MAFPRIRAACRLHRWIGTALAVLLIPESLTARGVALGELGPPRIVKVYLDPQTGRVLDVVDFRSSMAGWLHRNPPLARPGFDPLARNVRLTPDGALVAELTAHPGARRGAIFPPTAGANATRGLAPGEAAKAANNTGPLWRVQLREPDDGDLVTLSINGRTGDVVRMPVPLAGDRAALWMDPAHSRQWARWASLASVGVRDRNSAGAVCGHRHHDPVARTALAASQSGRDRKPSGSRMTAEGHMAEAPDRHLPMLHCNAKFRPRASFAKLGVRRG